MNAPRGWVASLLALLLFVGSGCIGTRAGIPPPDHWPLHAEQPAPSISIVVRGSATLNGTPSQIGDQFRNWQDETLRAYRESGLFADIRLGLAPSDLHSTVEITAAGHVNAGFAAFTGVLLHAIPHTIRTDYVLRTELRDRAGVVLGSWEHTEPQTVWVQILLLPFMPLRTPKAVTADIIFDLNRATLWQAQRNGIVGTASAPHVKVAGQFPRTVRPRDRAWTAAKRGRSHPPE